MRHLGGCNLASGAHFNQLAPTSPARVCATKPRITLQDKDRAEILARNITDLDELVEILCQFWPQDPIQDRIQEWNSDPLLRSMVYQEVQQWHYLFIPFRHIPRVEEQLKSQIQAAYTDILRDSNYPSSYIERIEQLILKMGFRRQTLDDKYLKEAVIYHSNRIVNERNARWKDYTSGV